MAQIGNPNMGSPLDPEGVVTRRPPPEPTGAPKKPEPAQPPKAPLPKTDVPDDSREEPLPGMDGRIP